jgi:uncharacterized membrane protein (DUF106 family)
MDLLIFLYTQIDEILMPFYRFPDKPLLGFYLGTFVLSLICVIIGESSISMAFRSNKERIACNNEEMSRCQSLSIKALKSGDKGAFKAINSIANDAYGKSFFLQIALSAAALWPVFISLGWMQYRFPEVEFRLPFFSNSYTFGYGAAFLVCYIAARVLSSKIRKTLPISKDQSTLSS